MKIVYIHSSNLMFYGYSLSNLLNTFYMVKIATIVADKGYDTTLYIFWDKNLNIKYKNVKIRLIKSDLNLFFNHKNALISIQLLFKRFSRDTIIHFHQPPVFFYILFTLFHLKNTIVIENHGNNYPNPFNIKSKFYWIYGILRRTLLPILIKKSKSIIVHNDTALKYFLSLGISKLNIKKVFYGLDFNKFIIFNKSKLKSKLGYNNKIVLLFVGRITSIKGIKELVLAFEEAKKVKTNLELVIIGPLEDVSYKDLIKPYWKGFKEGSKLLKWYSVADIFCLPSYNEPFGIVTLEAMYYNLPIITTSSAGTKELEKFYNPIIVPSKDISVLIKAILSVALSLKYYRSKSKTRNVIINTFSWNNIIFNYTNLYKSILNKK